jgi:hypothetical protein
MEQAAFQLSSAQLSTVQCSTVQCNANNLVDKELEARRKLSKSLYRRQPRSRWPLQARAEGDHVTTAGPVYGRWYYGAHRAFDSIIVRSVVWDGRFVGQAMLASSLH